MQDDERVIAAVGVRVRRQRVLEPPLPGVVTVALRPHPQAAKDALGVRVDLEHAPARSVEEDGVGRLRPDAVRRQEPLTQLGGREA